MSIHGDPSFAYPYFTGFPDEVGEGVGEGFNLNLALPEHLTAAAWWAALDVAMGRIADHAPDAVVLALGLDTAANDPTGTWPLTAEDIREGTRRIGGLGVPVVAVQEGGYGLRSLGRCARGAMAGLWEGAHPDGPRPAA